MGLGTTVTLTYWDEEAGVVRPISPEFPLPTGQGTSIVLPEGETVDTSNLATSAKQDAQTDQLRTLAAVAGGGAMTVEGAVEVSGTVNVGNAPLPVSLGADPVSVKFPTAQPVVFPSTPTVKLDGTVPVNGSVSAVQSGEWTVTPSGTQSVSVANTAPLKTTLENSPSVTVLNPVSTVTVANPVDTVAIAGQVTVANPVTSVSVSNQPTSIAISNTSIPVTQSGTWTTTPSGTQAVSGTVTSNAPALTSSSTTMSSYRNAALLATPVQVKSGAGRIHQYHFGNPNTSVVFLHIYNSLAANVTVGTTTPLATYMIAANAALDGFWPNSLNYSTGITLAATTTATGSTAPATGLLTNIGYL